MRGVVNDGLRWLIGAAITALSLPLNALLWTTVRTARRRHLRMRRRYGLVAATPVTRWSDDVERALQRQAARSGRPARLVFTSGSAATPKCVPYTDNRLRSVRRAYVDMFVRACRALGVRRRSLYVFSSFALDDSVTSLLLEERRLPPYLSTLQAPYRVHRAPSLLALASAYGPAAVRLWVLTQANPGVFYCTNPSTLSVFLDDLTRDWFRHARLVRDFREKPEAFDAAVHAIARRIVSRGASDRLAAVAASRAALPLQVFAPAVEAYVCWTGGQVKPFLDRLKVHLPPERYRLIPMYSMATETIETVPHFSRGTVAFVPMASGVCYEFIEEGAEDRTEHLLTPFELRVGTAYAMVVSDPYGLRRYQTGDLFLCRGFVAGLPDLEFLRRRDLGHSFTGEKLTAEQLVIVFQRLREQCPEIRSEDFLTCVPSQATGDHAPHYKIVLACSTDPDRPMLHEEVARRCDRLLSEVNREYESKRVSGRLGEVRVVRMGVAEFAERFGSASRSTGWESQFKFLPLSRETWESTDRKWFAQNDQGIVAAPRAVSRT